VGDDGKGLMTGQQEKVLSLMLAGETQKAAAESAGVAPETVSRWMSGDAVFVATLNQRRQDLWDANSAGLRDLAQEAIGVLADVMRHGETDALRLRAAVAVLKSQGLDVGERPTGKTNPERIKGDWAHETMIDAMWSVS